jgi:O-antigen/teichoic acid export membrane protein
MLSKLTSFEDVGFYTAAYRILEVCLLFSSTVIYAVLPAMSRYYKESKEKLKDLAVKTIKYIFTLVLPAVLIVFVYADKIIPLFYTVKYAPSILVLKILIFQAILVGFDQVLTGLLFSAGRQKQDFQVICLSSIIYIVLLFMFITRFGLYGAALATLVSMFIQLAIRLIYTRKFIFSFNIMPVVLKPFFFAAIAIVIGLLVNRINWMAGVFITGVVYSGFILGTGFIVLKDFKLSGSLKPNAQ